MTHREFVAAWLAYRLDGGKRIAQALGIDAHQLHNAATHMRKKGVSLPPLPAAYERREQLPPMFADKLDVEDLNKFITER